MSSNWLWGIPVVGAAAAVVAFGLRYGGRGRPFPDRSTEPELAPDVVEQVASLPEPPGNLAVSETGRIFSTYHPEARPGVKVFELVDGQPIPYPDEAWQRSRPKEPWFDQVFNVRVDRQNRLWTLDHGTHGARTPRLCAFDLDTDALVHLHEFTRDEAPLGSYMQDMQIDSAGRYIYIADIGVLAKRPAIVIYDTVTGTVRRVLQKHSSVTAETYEINAQGKRMYLLGGLYWMHPDLDPIALDKKDEWLYYGPMTGGTLYRIRTAHLNDPALSPAELATHVEAYADKAQCDGITIDLDDNIYLTGVEDGTINIIGTDRKQRTLVRHPKFRWPDGFSFGPDGWLYLADSDMPDVMMRSRRTIRAAAPFAIWRVRLNANSIAGH